MTDAHQNARRVFVEDGLPPEAMAMLQALYSRSPASVVHHLDQVRTKGPEKFMAQYYVGYGHASIGDCGDTVVFLENVSMLVAKAFQDHPLYDGQECSTRYLDFAVLPQVAPDDQPASRQILADWLALYNRVLPQLIAAVRLANPQGDAKQAQWENATKARAFDIARGLLPVGQTTSLSVAMNLRQFRDKLMQLKTHPLAEVRAAALDVFAALRARYPSSFGEHDMALDGKYADRAAYATAQAMAEHFIQPADVQRRWAGVTISNTVQVDARCFDHTIDQHEYNVLASRPQGAALDNRLGRYGVFNAMFLLDFGSFRDLQRHRNGVCQVPVITSQFGLHPWYLAQLENLLEPAAWLATRQEIERLVHAADTLTLQTDDNHTAARSYLYPMGMQVACELTYGLPQMVYVAELRSRIDVHATLRPVAIQLGHYLRENLPMLPLWLDESPDRWNLKRGDQTISKVA